MVLEATEADILQLRTTPGGAFREFGMVYPTSCTANGSNGGTAVMNNSFKFSISTGDTLTGTLCLEGSTAFVTVYDVYARQSTLFRCWRSAGNANACQRQF